MKAKYICMLLFVCTALNAQEQLTRQQYRELVQEYSQVLRQSKENTVATRAAEKASFKGFLPRIDLNGDATLNLRELNAWSGSGPGIINVGQNGETDLTFTPGTYHNHTFSAMVSVAQPLYTGGGLRAKREMAKADNKLSELSEEMTLDQINYQADAVYWNASSAKGLLDAAIVFKDIVQKQYDVINERFNDGMISRTDLLMIATRKQEAELQYITSNQNYQLAFQRLNILCGRDPNQQANALCPIGAVCEDVQRLNLNEVLDRRAEYKSADINIDKLKATKKAATSQYNPQMSVYVAGGFATATPHMGADVQFTPIAGVNLSIPLIRWGERTQTNRQQNAYIKIQELQKSYIKDNISSEFSAALTKLNETGKLVDTAQENMKLAQENLDLITLSYNEGRASIVEVLSAQLSWTQANNNMINSYLANKMAVAEYKKTISE